MSATTAAAVPMRARLTALAGALVLSPDTVLLRLSKLQTSDSLSTSMGITFYRGLGRLFFLPPLWMMMNGKGPDAFVAAIRALGVRRLTLGAFLYMVQNIAFIVSAELTYVASVLAIVATGPLFSAAFSALLLGEKVPRHTWLASLSCAGFVVIIYVDSFTEQSSARHFQGNLVALLVPIALGLYWVLCKATPGQDMVPALSLSGLSGAAASLSVIISNAGSRPDEKVGGPLTPRTDDGGSAAVALVSQTVIVAVAFMLLTVAAKDVPPAEVSLYMLTELILGEAGADMSAGRDAST